jgi:L,D-transpeptidase YcbB
LPALPAKSLKPGDDYSGAARLQHLLVALGDAPPPAPDAPLPQSLSPALVDALKHFQSRHGEKADGVVGAATFIQLTRPL